VKTTKNQAILVQTIGLCLMVVIKNQVGLGKSS
jgi:hypothetical protein